MNTTRLRRRGALTFGLAALLLLGACGSSGSGASGSSSTSSTTTKTKVQAGTGMHAKRYCEVLLLHPAPAGPTADVYNTFPLNACPEAQWQAMDAAAIAQENDALIALLNGPRYWLMDGIKKQSSGPEVRKTFGGMEMIQRATVLVPDPIAASKPYVVNSVNRETVFTFDKGTMVYEITDADGTTFVMQSWSQQIDPTLSESDLATLGSRLQLPTGWTYRARTLTAPLRVVTTSTTAKVVQDELKNSYSMETS